MNFDKIVNIGAMIVVVSGVTSVLMRGSAAAAVINALGDSFSGAIRASMGR